MKYQPIIRDRVYIHESLIDIRKLNRWYKHFYYDENTCQRCDNLKNRHNNKCTICPAFLGRMKLWNETPTANGIWYGLPNGHLQRISNLLNVDLFYAKDERSVVRMPYRLTFTGQLFDGTPYPDGTPRVNQQELVKQWLQYKFGILRAPPRAGGKCQVGDTYLFTEYGMVQIQDLFDNEKDDSVTQLSINIKTPCGYKMSNAKYVKMVNTTNKIITKYGYHVQGTPHHKVLVLTKEARLKWIPAKDIQKGDYICIEKSQNVWSNHNKVSLEVAELLGYLIANGGLNIHYNKRVRMWKFVFTTKNKMMQNRFIYLIKKLGGKHKVFNGKDTLVCGKELIMNLESVGLNFILAKNKTIPWAILQSSKDIITKFLSAYFSCDSYIPRKGSIELCSASFDLINQLQILLTNYGIISRYHIKNSYARNSNAPIEKIYYNLNIDNTSRRSFLKIFTFLKSYEDVDSYIEARYDALRIPFIKERIRKFKDKYYLTNGRYRGVDNEIIKLPSLECCYRKDGDTLSRNSLQILYNNIENIKKIDVELAYDVENLYKCRNIIFQEVVSNDIIHKDVKVYDISIPSVKCYIANGIIVHNTVIACWLACNSGLRTIVFVHYDRLAQQFLDSFNKFTNLIELSKHLQRPLVGIVYKMADFDKYEDVVIVNYQKFIGDLSDRIVKYIYGKFGFCICDEAHRIGALAMSKVISRVDCKYKLGLTATPWRRDHRHLITRDIIGPITAESHTVAILPEIFIHWTDIGVSPYKRFTTYRKWLHEHEERRNIVVRQVFADLRSGHRVIIIPVDTLIYQADLIEAINKQSAINRAKRFEPWPKDLAIALNEKSDNNEVFKMVDSGRLLVLIAIRKMIREGVNMLWPSVLYSVEPTSAVRVNDVGAPLFEQLAYRICTHFPKKKQPIIRLFIDPGISHACAKNLLRYEIFRRLAPQKNKAGNVEQPRYKMNEQQIAIAKDILKRPVEGLGKRKIFRGY